MLSAAHSGPRRQGGGDPACVPGWRRPRLCTRVVATPPVYQGGGKPRLCTRAGRGCLVGRPSTAPRPAGMASGTSLPTPLRPSFHRSKSVARLFTVPSLLAASRFALGRDLGGPGYTAQHSPLDSFAHPSQPWPAKAVPVKASLLFRASPHINTEQLCVPRGLQLLAVAGLPLAPRLAFEVQPLHAKGPNCPSFPLVALCTNSAAA
jgi:hypothetical protein